MNSTVQKRAIRRDELRESAEDKELRTNPGFYLPLVVPSLSSTNFSKVSINKELRLGQRQDKYSWHVVA